MNVIFHIFQNSHLPELVALWNAAAADNYGFYPITVEQYTTHLSTAPLPFSPEKIIVASYERQIVGMLHYELIDIAPYPFAGVISALLVHPDYRGRGFARALLQEAITRITRYGVEFIDAFGCWPYSSHYVGFIDGSERAGVDSKNAAARSLLETLHFRRERESLRMQADLLPLTTRATDDLSERIETPAEITENTRTKLVYCQTRAGKHTWLDKCFRRWTTYDHILLSESGGALSQAVFARMDGLAEYCGQEIYSMYAVNTPAYARRRGYAHENLTLIKKRLSAQGGQTLEIHVFADNVAAVQLYQHCDFKLVGNNFIYRYYQR